MNDLNGTGNGQVREGEGRRSAFTVRTKNGLDQAKKEKKKGSDVRKNTQEIYSML